MVMVMGLPSQLLSLAPRGFETQGLCSYLSGHEAYTLGGGSSGSLPPQSPTSHAQRVSRLVQRS